jgi:hypothetical protein
MKKKYGIRSPRTNDHVECVSYNRQWGIRFRYLVPGGWRASKFCVSPIRYEEVLSRPRNWRLCVPRQPLADVYPAVSGSAMQLQEDLSAKTP